jgi:hypothetical protein
MAGNELRFGALGPAMLFAGTATLAVAALLWLRHGGEIFHQLVLTGLPLCL